MTSNRIIFCALIGVASYLPGFVLAACVDDHPVITVTTEGGGQRESVNQTLNATFKGHIMTTVGLTSHGRNFVEICPGTTVEYSVQSSVGGGLRATPDCSGRFNYGALAAGEKLICNNSNLGGSDVDKFTVKEGR